MVLPPDYPIETERLRLRPFTRGDVDAVYSLPPAGGRGAIPVRRADDATRASPRRCSSASGRHALAEEGDKIFLAVERLRAAA